MKTMRFVCILIFSFIGLAGVCISGEYDRSDWPGWADVDHDCQDTRAELLIKTSFVDVHFKTNRCCYAATGFWICPYTRVYITDASDADIDHIVPLANAHNNGAEYWSTEKRYAFANDPENLIVTSSSANRSKGQKDPGKWRPPIQAYWPRYALDWIYIKEKYDLSYGQGELDALGEMLKSGYGSKTCNSTVTK